MANGVWKMVHEPYAISPQPLAMTRFVVFLGALALAASGCVARQADLRPTPGQNVLLITIDTLRADALGSYGGPAATPALDRLAREGVRFDFAHAHAVVTLSSHASRHGKRPLPLLLPSSSAAKWSFGGSAGQAVGRSA